MRAGENMAKKSGETEIRAPKLGAAITGKFGVEKREGGGARGGGEENGEGHGEKGDGIHHGRRKAGGGGEERGTLQHAQKKKSKSII